MQSSAVTNLYEKARKLKAPFHDGQGILRSAYRSKPGTKSPVSLKEFELLKDTILWTDEDEKYIRLSAKILADQVDDIFDVWYSFLKVEPQLARYLGPRTPWMQRRFKQWILDTTNANYDQKWLNSQHEIALRYFAKKKQRRNSESINSVNFRYIVALAYPLTATLKPFLAKKNLNSAEDVECMYQAWIKSVYLQVCLWSQPYIKEGVY